MQIFVDCDDTLVLYDSHTGIHPYGVRHGEPWRPNQPLVDALLETEHPVFVWSGGVARYAEIIAGKLGLDFPCLDKDEITFELIHEGDVVIDDQELGGKLHITRSNGQNRRRSPASTDNGSSPVAPEDQEILATRTTNSRKSKRRDA
jgi:hypothetical protein